MEELHNRNGTADMLKIAYVAVALFVITTSGVRIASAEQQVSFSADKQIVRAGYNVELLVEGLVACSGELVEVGWFGADSDEPTVALVPIDTTGRGRITLALPTPDVLSAGVRHSCVDGGGMISDVTLFVVDPENPPDPGEATFRWGEGLDLYASVPVGETVILFAEGVSTCAGQVIKLGFFAGLGSADLAVTAQVDESGRASAILVPTAPAIGQHPGALGDCVECGFVLGQQPFVSTVAPPNGNHGGTPIAPVVGQGTRDAGISPSRSTLLAGGLFAVVASCLVLGWVTKRH